MADGCLVVYKPKGYSSHDIINMIRRSYKVKCGHAGTLDPMAQGVLLVFMGKALKLLSFIPHEHLDKAYLMRVTMGKVTDSYDATGKVVETFDGDIDFSKETLLENISKFIGSYEQQPPVFSAIKVDGKRSYALARAGKEVKLKTRPVEVPSIKLISDFELYGERNLILRVHCSRGTYIRSIAHDLGQELGCGGHLSYLLRERVGQWSFNEAFPLWKVEKAIPFKNTRSFMNFSDILPIPKVFVGKKTEAKVMNGAPINLNDILRVETNGHEANSIEAVKLVQIIAEDNTLIALYGSKQSNKKGQLSYQLCSLKVFPR